MNKEKTSITLDADVLERLKEEAVKLDRSVSWIINEMVKAHLIKEDAAS